MPTTDTSAGRVMVYRHRLPVRIMHWINVLAVTVLFMSGLQIFNAFPVVHFGRSAYDGTTHALEIGVRLDGTREPRAAKETPAADTAATDDAAADDADASTVRRTDL